MKHVWLIEEGRYYSEGYPLRVCRTKKIAEKTCRNAGFKWDSEQKLFLHDTYLGDDFGTYRRLNKMDYIEEENECPEIHSTCEGGSC